ncbi:MAG: D-alanyl-D-alanine carboxypeptidase, partial [Thiothrix sp.]|nr:D-alanyl-D-alanine carboxypeptidase [Thiothrix sp.]
MLKRVLCMCLLLSATAAFGAEGETATLPEVEQPDATQVVSLAPGAPDVDATSFLLVDYQSGEELVAYNQNARVEPASLTKLMTAYILYRELARGSIKLDDEVLISQRAWEMKGSRMFVEVGKKVQLEKLLRGLIIQSGNDAAVALAEHVAGSEEAFVERMN